MASQCFNVGDWIRWNENIYRVDSLDQQSFVIVGLNCSATHRIEWEAVKSLSIRRMEPVKIVRTEAIDQSISNAHSGNKYLREIQLRDGKVDVYAVPKAFDVRCPARQHAIKKLLCAGIRAKATSRKTCGKRRMLLVEQLN